MVCQVTLKSSVSATGVGLHSGCKVYLTIHPAPENTGIVFRLYDDINHDPVAEIPAKAEYVGDTLLCTTLVKDGHRIMTVEHLLSALAGLGVDNAIIDLTAPEVPIMDGSAAPFVFLIQSAGIKKQKALKRFVRIKKRVLASSPHSGDSSAKSPIALLEPFNGFKMDFTIEYAHPVFSGKPQSATFSFSSTGYVKDISRARTYGFLADYEKLRKQDLALGGSLDNAVVLDEFKVMNEEGLRYRDEFVRHKMLDALGDLYLLGSNIIGAFSGYKSGHSLNNLLLKKLLEDKEAWEVVTFPEGAGAQKSPVMFGSGFFDQSPLEVGA